MLFALPMRINDARLDWAMELLATIQNHARGTVELDFTKTKEITAAGYAILACMNDARIESEVSVKLKNTPPHLRKLPILKNLTSEQKRFPTPAEYKHSAINLWVRGGGTAIQPSLVDELEEHFSRDLDENLKYDVRLILNELMQNTVDHSTAERFLIYGGLEADEFHFGVLDMGVTIPAKLEQKYRAEDDRAFLHLALERGITTRRQRPGGLGLSYFFDFLKNREGQLTIISRNAQYRKYFRTRRSLVTPLKQPLRGTWCFARVKTNKGIFR